MPKGIHWTGTHEEIEEIRRKKNAAYRKKRKEENPDSIKIASWKQRGMIHNDWDFMYSIFMWWNTCDICNKVFTNSRDKQLEHNHFIKDRENIRGIVCNRCNTILRYEDRFKELMFNRLKFAVKISKLS